jgi:hypothetical protein
MQTEFMVPSIYLKKQTVFLPEWPLLILSVMYFGLYIFMLMSCVGNLILPFNSPLFSRSLTAFSQYVYRYAQTFIVCMLSSKKKKIHIIPSGHGHICHVLFIPLHNCCRCFCHVSSDYVDGCGIRASNWVPHYILVGWDCRGETWEMRVPCLYLAYWPW